MKYWGSLQSAFRGLRANALRSLLTMLGIIIGVAAVITMLAIGAGAQTRIAEQIRSLGANLLMVMPGAAKEDGARLEAGTRHTLTESDAAAIWRELPLVANAAPTVRGALQLVHGNRNWNAIVNGTTPEYFLAREWPVGSGRTFNGREVTSAAKVAR